jgi:hypothetical protein
MQSERNFVRNRDAPTRQAKDHSILTIAPDPRSQDGMPQYSPGISAILKELRAQEHVD